MSIRKDDPLPLNHQVARELRRRIRHGDLEPGQRLPSERALSERYGISRMTLRQAVARLVQEGWLRVRHGSGTFVAQPKLSFDAVHLMGFTESILAQDGAVASDVLEQAVHPASDRVATALDLDQAEPVVNVVRLRYVDGIAVALERSALPHRSVEGLEHEDLAHGSLYGLLRNRYGVELQRAEQDISALVAATYEAALFGIPEGRPLLSVEGVAFADDGAPAEHFEVLYRGDRFKLAVTSDRPSTGPHPGLQMVLGHGGTATSPTLQETE